MKILFAISTMQDGGAERTVANLANYFANQNNEVIIMVLDNNESFYNLDVKIDYRKLDLYRDNKKVINKILRYKKIINKIRKLLKEERPDIMLSMNYKLLPIIIMANIFINIPIVCSERSNPYIYPSGLTWRYLRKILSIACDGYIFQTERAKKYFPLKTQSKSVIIQNPISSQCELYKDIYIGDKKQIVAVGRLNRVKGFDLLIKSFSRIADEIQDINLIIYGEGPERNNLTNLIEKLKLDNRVTLYGKSTDVLNEIKNSKMFILSSRNEGMPNSLMEAMAIGLPCISTKCELGPEELIENNINGLLVEVDDVEEMSQSILKLINDRRFAKILSKNALKIRETNSLKKISMEYYIYFQRVIEKKKCRIITEEIISVGKNVLKSILIKLNLLEYVYEKMDDIEWLRLRYFTSKDDYKYAINYLSIRNKENYNIKSPKTFDEKLWWLKLNYRDDLLTLCTDKYKVREYIIECGFEDILVKLYGKYDSFEDINFKSLPSEFIIKANHVSGGNYICRDKSKLDKKKLSRKYKKLLKRNYYLRSREWNYKNIEPCLIIEEVLNNNDDLPLLDYKFMCFNGEPKLLFIDIGVANNDGSHSRNYYRNIYDMNFEPVNMKETRESYKYELIDKPSNFEEMIKIARKLSKPFPHARVDLYNVNGKIYFGEITFYHGGGVNNIEPQEMAFEMGKWINLSRF